MYKTNPDVHTCNKRTRNHLRTNTSRTAVLCNWVSDENKISFIRKIYQAYYKIGELNKKNL